jgi:hypothetical protein
MSPRPLIAPDGDGVLLDYNLAYAKAWERAFPVLLAGPKELVWGDGNHYDYYDSPAQVDFAVRAVAEFMDKHLS